MAANQSTMANSSAVNAMLRAAETGDVAALKTAFDDGVDVMAKDAAKNTAVHTNPAFSVLSRCLATALFGLLSPLRPRSAAVQRAPTRCPLSLLSSCSAVRACLLSFCFAFSLPPALPLLGRVADA